MLELPTNYKLLLTLLAATLVGCATVPLRQTPRAATLLANHDVPAVRGYESCGDVIAAPSSQLGPMLDPTAIGLFVWNIQKGRNSRSLVDLSRLAGSKDLVLIQEARLEQRPQEALDSARYWSFAPGYETASGATGVMTLSKAVPLTHCHLTDREPWLRSPKAISVTKFALASSDQTLAVVNVHAVNFTFGVADFDRQIAKIESVLARHAGPVILAGDFNTWRAGRLAVLRALSARLRLTELSFETDHRVSPFGAILDHVFVRHLEVIDASTEAVDSSDHNPMSVTLRVR